MSAPVAKVRTLKNVAKYDSLPMITPAGRTMEDWDDSKVLLPKSYELKVLTTDEVNINAKELLDGLTTGMTEKLAYTVILLAWNMRSKSDPKKRIFPVVSPIPAEKSVADLSTLVSQPLGPGHEIILPTKDEEKEEFARQGCFLAASLLKLFTKEEGSWLKAQKYIAEGYKKFTDQDFSIKSITVHDASVSALRRHFQTKVDLKNTLGGILYSLKGLKEGRGMTQMLFEQHLSFTGLHIVGLFCRACFGLQTKPSSLLSALHTSAYEPILDQLALIIREYMGSSVAGKEKETYKYARLYDSNMFSLLQTKNCSDLVCILGHLGQSCGNIGQGNVMEIAAISSMSEEAKEVYQKVATNIFTYFKDKKYS